MINLLLGTTNQAKLADYQEFLKHSDIDLINLRDIDLIDEPLEIGKTFEENSLLKARYYAEKTELVTLSDDGGFEIDFLDGRPGVDSNRWVGPYGTDEDRIKKVLELMKGVPWEKRTARLRFVTTVYFPQEREHVSVEGSIEGFVAKDPHPKRVKGFPYRPIFYLPEFEKTMIEIDERDLQKINYRKKACQRLLLKLEPYLNS